MDTVTVFVARDPKACWKLFTDVALLNAWVPGLRRAQVLSTEKGLPAEVHFEFSKHLAYTLVYRYDVEALELRWEPKLGRRDAVSGFARFAPSRGGTELSYGIEHGQGRGPDERRLGDVAVVVEALQRWLEAHLPPTQITAAS